MVFHQYYHCQSEIIGDIQKCGQKPVELHGGVNKGRHYSRIDRRDMEGGISAYN